MKQGLSIKNGIIIPDHELEITASRSGGAGGQHVNKTSSKITIRWNVRMSSALTEEQKHRIEQNLSSRLTADGDLIVHNSESRSQQQNKERALAHLASLIRKGLYVPKKRMKTKVPEQAKKARVEKKRHHGEVKKMRGKKGWE
jgi:ribosome-associated protein